MTELGEIVNSVLKDAFPSIVDVNFTADLESLLDSIGDGKVHWKTVVENFYPDLDEAVRAAREESVGEDRRWRMRRRMSSARNAEEIWSSSMVRTESLWPARASRTVATRSRIWRRSAWPVRSAARIS